MKDSLLQELPFTEIIELRKHFNKLTKPKHPNATVTDFELDAISKNLKRVEEIDEVILAKYDELINSRYNPFNNYETN